MATVTAMATEILTMKIKMNDLCDFHAHILPGADHGSSSCENSSCQLELARKCGVSRIVATPHFYPQRTSVSDFVRRRDTAYNSILNILPEGISVVPGAEVLLCENMEKLPDLPKLCIGKSNIMLLELPYTDLGSSYLYTMSAIMERGFEIVLAHAERYEFSYVNEFVSFGAKIQLNASSLCRFFGIEKNILNWLENGSVIALGSDIHGASPKAYNHFVRAQKRISKYIPYIKDYSDRMWERVNDSSGALALT